MSIVYLFLTAIEPIPPAQPAAPAQLESPAQLEAPRPAAGINLATMVSADDYPMAALRAEEQGTVQARIGIDTNGQVDSCVVEQSSGSMALDARTCEILRSRARYSPARDSKGQPTRDSALVRISWRIPDYYPIPTDPSTVRAIFDLDAKGRSKNCRAEVTGTAVGYDPCAKMSKIAKEMLKKAPEGVVLSNRKLVFEWGRMLGGGDGAALIGRGEGMVLASQEIFVVSVNEEGRVVDCRPVDGQSTEARIGEVCIIERLSRYEPLAPGITNRSVRQYARFEVSYVSP